MARDAIIAVHEAFCQREAVPFHFQVARAVDAHHAGIMIVVDKALQGVDYLAPLLAVGIPGPGGEGDSIVGVVVAFTNGDGDIRVTSAAVPDSLGEVGHGMHNGRIGIVMTAEVVSTIYITAKINRLAPVQDDQSRCSLGGAA